MRLISPRMRIKRGTMLQTIKGSRIRSRIASSADRETLVFQAKSLAVSHKASFPSPTNKLTVSLIRVVCSKMLHNIYIHRQARCDTVQYRRCIVSNVVRNSYRAKAVLPVFFFKRTTLQRCNWLLSEYSNFDRKYYVSPAIEYSTY